MHGKATKIGLVGGLMPGVINHMHGLILERAMEKRQHVVVLTDDSLRLPNLHDHTKYSAGEFGPQLAKCVRKLVQRGATRILVPSMIAQTRREYFGRSLPQHVQLLDLVETAVLEMKKRHVSARVGAVMCHQSVWEAGLFQAAFAKHDMQLVDASADRALILMHTSHAVESVYYGNLEGARASIAAAARLLQRRGAEAILLGSAALPLAWPVQGLDVPLVNPLLAAVETLLSEVDAESVSDAELVPA